MLRVLQTVANYIVLISMVMNLVKVVEDAIEKPGPQKKEAVITLIRKIVAYGNEHGIFKIEFDEQFVSKMIDVIVEIYNLLGVFKKKEQLE